MNLIRRYLRTPAHRTPAGHLSTYTRINNLPRTPGYQGRRWR